MAGDWGEVVTRYPYRKVGMDHLLSRSMASFELVVSQVTSAGSQNVHGPSVLQFSGDVRRLKREEKNMISSIRKRGVREEIR